MKKKRNFHFKFASANLKPMRFSEKKIQKEISKKFSQTSFDASFKFLESMLVK